jgi:predicted Holliday junction resolvase-like endonuclease
VVAILLVALIVVIAAAVWLAVQYAAYRASHPHTAADVAAARQDSLSRSRSVTLGKTQEHLAPLFPEFLSKYHPNDARFLGMPLDFIVFDGLCEGDDVPVREVVFVEIKTGKSSLSKREKRIREAVDAGRVSYEVIRLPGVVDVPESDNAVPALPAG